MINTIIALKKYIPRHPNYQEAKKHSSYLHAHTFGEASLNENLSALLFFIYYQY